MTKPCSFYLTRFQNGAYVGGPDRDALTRSCNADVLKLTIKRREVLVYMEKHCPNQCVLHLSRFQNRAHVSMSDLDVMTGSCNVDVFKLTLNHLA